MLEKKLGGVGKNTHGRASPWLVDGRLLSGSLHGREKEAGVRAEAEGARGRGRGRVTWCPFL